MTFVWGAGDGQTIVWTQGEPFGRIFPVRAAGTDSAGRRGR